MIPRIGVVTLSLLLNLASLADAKTFELKVLTFNIKGLPLPRVGRDRFEKIGNYLKTLREQGRGFDVVLIQEAFSRPSRRINEFAHFPYQIFGPKRHGIKTGSGLVILSELPIRLRNSLVYQDAAGWDKLSHKGVMLAELNLPGMNRPILVLNTHMQAGPDRAPGVSHDETDTIRLRQIMQAKDFLMDNTSRQDIVIFGGDFNFSYNRTPEHYEAFLEGNSFLNSGHHCSSNPTCFKDAESRHSWSNAIDHVFFQPPWNHDVSIAPQTYKTRFNQIDDPILSDHVARQVNFVIETND